MLNLPQATETNKQLPKTSIYKKFNMNTAQKDSFDKEISKIYISNTLSLATINIDKGDNVVEIYVISLDLKTKDYDINNIIKLTKLIDHKMVFVLNYQDEIQLAIYHTKLICTDWKSKDDFILPIVGLNFDIVWENIVIYIGDIQLEDCNDLEEQLLIDETKQKIAKEIAKLRKKADSENQPKKRIDLIHKIRDLEKKL